MGKVELDEDFGFCRICRKWVYRATMMSINMKIFNPGINNHRETLRFRMCKSCFDDEYVRFKKGIDGKSKVWNGYKDLKKAKEIMRSETLSQQCDYIEFDDSEVVSIERLD